MIVSENENGERDRQGQPNTTALSFAAQQAVSSSQDEYAEVFALLKRKAEFEADNRYDNDLQDVLDRGEEWPTDKATERDASVKANVALRPYVDSDIDIESAKLFYVRQYLARYHMRYEKDTGNGTLPNKETKQVQHVAQVDARNDKQDETDLSDAELTYQAVIHIQELFAYRTRASSGYLTHIMGYIPHYKRAYREEKDRPQRSGPFPGSWSPGR